MKKILFSLFTLLIASAVSAQISVYEYKNDKAYCTFELDSEIVTDSIPVRGTYRTYQFYDIPYFEMTFSAISYILETGETVIAITPDFYYHSYLAKLAGQREPMNPKYYKLTFARIDDTMCDITPDEEKAKMLKKSVYTEKETVDFTKLPPAFAKVKSVDWKRIPKDLKKTLQTKDKNLGRRY